MMVYTKYTRNLIVHFHKKRLRPSEIVKKLESENIRISRSGVWRSLKHYDETGSIKRKRGSGRPTVITDDVKNICRRCNEPR